MSDWHVDDWHGKGGFVVVEAGRAVLMSACVEFSPLTRVGASGLCVRVASFAERGCKSVLTGVLISAGCE